jgi:iron(III) transport system substrate-binding protein
MIIIKILILKIQITRVIIVTFSKYLKLSIFSLLAGTLSIVSTNILAQELVVYSGRSDKFIKPVIKNFTKQTGIKVILHSGKSTALLNKLKVEGARTKADLYISNDAGNLQKGSDLKLFAPIPIKLTKQVPLKFRSELNDWLGLSARARVLVVNTKVIMEPVDSVFDLAEPRFEGKLAITHSSNGSYIAGVTVYLLAVGESKIKAWLQGMKKNAQGKVFDKHSKIVKAVAKGKKYIGLVNHYYIYRHLDKHPDAPIKIIIPDQGDKGMGIAWNVAGIAVTKSSKQKNNANKLIEFLLSDAGQKQFAEVNREYPIRSDVPAAAMIPAIKNIKVSDVAMSELGKQRDRTIDLIEAVGMP